MQTDILSEVLSISNFSPQLLSREPQLTTYAEIFEDSSKKRKNIEKCEEISNIESSDCKDAGEDNKPLNNCQLPIPNISEVVNLKDKSLNNEEADYGEQLLKEDLEEISNKSLVVQLSDYEKSESGISIDDISSNHTSDDDKIYTETSLKANQNASVGIVDDTLQESIILKNDKEIECDKHDIIEDSDIKSAVLIKQEELTTTDVPESPTKIAAEYKIENDKISDSDTVLNIKSENNKSQSACTNENVFVPPSEQLKESVIKQVEMYFSDANLLKDTFLLRHVRRTKEGYVSLKLVSSFRKVKSLTKNWKVVAYSLKFSDKLEINNEGTKVRRKDPIPEYDETASSRTVVIANAPVEKLNVDNIWEYFSKYGKVSRIRFLKVGKDIPRDIRRFLAMHPELIRMTSFCVEYEKRDEACKALNECTLGNEWHNATIMPLLVNKQKESALGSSEIKKKRPKKKNRRNYEETAEIEREFKKNGRKQRSRLTKVEESNQASYRERFSRQTHQQFYNLRTPPDVLKWRLTPLRSPINRSKKYNDYQIARDDILKHSVGDNAGMGGIPNQWEKRKYSSKDIKLKGSQNFHLLIPDGVVRLPRGPDGTRGFQKSRAQMST